VKSHNSSQYNETFLFIAVRLVLYYYVLIGAIALKCIKELTCV